MTERIVIKIGGATFFQRNGFEHELQPLLSQNQNAQVWLLVGGGDLIESMRTIHQIYPSLNAEEIHWRCVELLDHTWAIAKEIVFFDHSITNREELNEASLDRVEPGICWVRVQAFYNREDCENMPEQWRPTSNWNTTTDALAWLLGKMIDADRVILLKKCECDPNWSIEEAAKRGVVDTELARLVQSNPGARPIVDLYNSQE